MSLDDIEPREEECRMSVNFSFEGKRAVRLKVFFFDFSKYIRGNILFDRKVQRHNSACNSFLFETAKVGPYIRWQQQVLLLSSRVQEVDQSCRVIAAFNISIYFSA